MENNLVTFLLYLFHATMFTALLPAKVFLFFATFGMIEEFWPVTHSPMLMLSVVLHQSSRPQHIGRYLNTLVRLAIALSIGIVGLDDWLILFGLAWLWNRTVRPSSEDYTAWKEIRSRQEEMLDRVLGVMRELWPTESEHGKGVREVVIGASVEDEFVALKTIETEKEVTLVEEPTHPELWIEMDNAPPIAEATENERVRRLPFIPRLTNFDLSRA
jgi:hypothetical protein